MSNAPVSPFQLILAWSAAWPDWQKDALRRIICSGPLTDNDLKELAALCRAKHGLLPANEKLPVPEPLTSVHIPGGTGGTSSVSLRRLYALNNVGRIPSNQEIVFGTSPGITIIYGENGTGKSGYARVIKKACRARGAMQGIKANAFTTPSRNPATAKIEYRVAAVDKECDWRDGAPSDPYLGNIFVFDSISARAHVGDDGPACFKPQGMDVLPQLSQVCIKIKTEVKTEIEDLKAEITRVAGSWDYKSSSKVGALLNNLGPLTTPEAIEEAAMFTAADETKLNEINATLSADPKIKSADTTSAAKRIREFADKLIFLTTMLDESMMQKIKSALMEADATSKAAKAAAGPELKTDDLPGSCTAVWLKLWEAAKAFSITDAYPGRDYPVTEAGARCVLCQQELGADAVDRYSRFNKFVMNQTRIQAEVAKANVDTLKQDLESLKPITTATASIKADIDREFTGSFADIEIFANAIDGRIAHVQTCLNTGVWSDAAIVPVSPATDLLVLAGRLEERAACELAAADPEQAKALAIMRDELVDRKWLSNKKAEVLVQIEQYKSMAKREKCLDDCDTNIITRKTGELEEAYVTKAFRKAFIEELDTLGMKTLPVKLEEAKPLPGQRRHGVRIEGVPVKSNGDPHHKVDEIASEGEHRCIALAAFLAELSQASHRSALVFDDPVSSLDHAHRAKVAKRLVKEAMQRQVIVFTHDVVFLCEIFDNTENTPVKYMHLCWVGNEPGHCEIGLPWDWKKYTERLDALEKEQRRIANSWSMIPNPKNVADMRLAYTHLSATLERIVQDVILNGVIGRYRGWVRVENLEKVVGFSANECATILRIDKKCSDVTCRHDPAAAKSAPVPDPVDLLDDLNALKKLVEEVKGRPKYASVPSALQPLSGAHGLPAD